ncbi:putative amino-acid metabolite efflux pump [compost metagenome]
MVWGGLVPIGPFALLSYWFEGPARITAALGQIPMMSVLAICYLSFAATLFGYTMWGRLLTRYPASKVAPLTLLVPVVGLISAHALLGEDLSLAQWLGALVVMGGLLLNVFGGRLGAGRRLVRR